MRYQPSRESVLPVHGWYQPSRERVLPIQGINLLGTASYQWTAVSTFWGHRLTSTRRYEPSRESVLKYASTKHILILRACRPAISILQFRDIPYIPCEIPLWYPFGRCNLHVAQIIRQIIDSLVVHDPYYLYFRADRPLICIICMMYSTVVVHVAGWERCKVHDLATRFLGCICTVHILHNMP